MWPQEVKTRIHDTYMYFGGSLIFTAASAIAASRSPTMMRLMTKNSLMVSFILKGRGYLLWNTLCNTLHLFCTVQMLMFVHC